MADPSNGQHAALLLHLLCVHRCVTSPLLLAYVSRLSIYLSMHWCFMGLTLLQELGASGLSKRPTSCMLVLPQPVKGPKADDEEQKEFEKEYHEVEKKIKAADSL